MTLEEAQAEILRLNEELEATKTERDSYSTKATDTEKELEKVRRINQEYFLKLTAKYTPPTPPEDSDEDQMTLEDFAKTLTI